MTQTDDGYAGWLETRRVHWQVLSHWLDSGGTRRSTAYAALLRLERAYSALASDVALARSIYGTEAALTRQLEALLVAATARMKRDAMPLGHAAAELFGQRIRQRMWAMRRRLAAAVALFFSAGLAGAWLISGNPELAGVFASEAMIEAVQAGELWTDNLLAVAPPSLLSVGIMTNNIVVALSAFVLGAFYGLGTLYILVLNGFLLGGTFAFTAHYDLDANLARFIAAHGPVELSVIWITAAAGIGLGEALARPGNRSRADAFRAAANEARDILFVCLPFLVGAGLIEGYVSPNAAVGMPTRLAVGFGYEIILVLTLAGYFAPRARRTGSIPT